MVRDSGLSTLSDFTDVEEREYARIKYIETLDKVFLLEPLTVLIEGGKSTATDKVGQIVSEHIDLISSRAKSSAVTCLNEALCAHSCLCSQSILSGAENFRMGVKNIVKKTGIPFDDTLKRTDLLISEVNSFTSDF